MVSDTVLVGEGRRHSRNSQPLDFINRYVQSKYGQAGRGLEDSGTRSTCAIARLFAIYVVSDVGNSVPSRLNSLPLETKEQVVQSIIERIQDVVQKPRDTPEAMDIVSDDLLNLIPSSCKLAEGMGEGGGFAHRDILFEGARALSSIMEDAALKGLQKPKSITLDAGINSLVTVAISHSIVPRALDGLLEGGIISCILRSLPYANMDDPRSQGLKGPAWRLLPFLTDSRFYNAAKTGGGAPDLLKELGDTPRSKIVESIYNSYSLVLRLGKIAFGETRDAVQMCYSLKHQLPAERSVDLAALKTCSTCHAAYYCSRECQKEDWSTFHSVECIRALTRWRPNLKDAGMTERIERDKLAFIEVLANRFLPPLPDIIAREKSSNNANSQPGKNVNDRVRVHIFDLAGKLFRESKSLKLMEYECTTLSAYFKKHEHVIGDRTQARLGQAAKDVELDPESGVLVAGTFTGHHIIVCICAKMQYNPKGAVGERYRAVTHACSVQTMPPAVFEFASKMGMLNI
ncbi:hypothetical protein NMY22_g5269 [Coprinellus aureogranulatus]|nr:hypothetical protein NMY22_g5269 [Coprinellus aureogranulatus]